MNFSNDIRAIGTALNLDEARTGDLLAAVDLAMQGNVARAQQPIPEGITVTVGVSAEAP